MTGYCQIGPIDIAASELMDEMKFDDATSIDELNQQLSILTTHKLAKDVQGLSRWGELVWIEGGTTLVDNLNFVHRGLYKMGTVGIGIENADYALVHIPCRNYSNSDMDVRLRMDYTTGVNDGTYLSSGYDDTTLNTLLDEDFSDYDTTNVWYPKNSSGITSHSFTSDGSKLVATGKASSNGVTGGMITQSRERVDTNFICDFGLEWVAGLPSGYNSFGVIFSNSTNNIWSHFHTIRSNTNYFRIELRGTASAANIVVTKVVNGSVTDMKTVALTSGQKTPVFRFKYYTDGSAEVWCNKAGSAITESVADGDTLILSRSLLGLTFKNYVYVSYDFTTNYATATQTFKSSGISFSRYESMEVQNIVTIPYHATLRNSTSFSNTKTRGSEYGNLLCIVNPLVEPEFNMNMEYLHSEGVQLHHTLNGVDTRIFNTDTVINPDGFSIKNGIIKLIVNGEDLDFYYWDGIQYILLNSFDLGSTIQYVQILNIGNYMGRVQIDDIILTMRFGTPYFWVEHPLTSIGYNNGDLYYHDGENTSYPGSDIDITMDDLSYCKIFDGYINELSINQSICGEDGTTTGFEVEGEATYYNYATYNIGNAGIDYNTTGFTAMGDPDSTTLRVEFADTENYYTPKRAQGKTSLKVTCGGTEGSEGVYWTVTGLTPGTTYTTQVRIKRTGVGNLTYKVEDGTGWATYDSGGAGTIPTSADFDLYTLAFTAPSDGQSEHRIYHVGNISFEEYWIDSIMITEGTDVYDWISGASSGDTVEIERIYRPDTIKAAFLGYCGYYGVYARKGAVMTMTSTGATFTTDTSDYGQARTATNTWEDKSDPDFYEATVKLIVPTGKQVHVFATDKNSNVIGDDITVDGDTGVEQEITIEFENDTSNPTCWLCVQAVNKEVLSFKITDIETPNPFSYYESQGLTDIILLNGTALAGYYDYMDIREYYDGIKYAISKALDYFTSTSIKVHWGVKPFVNTSNKYDIWDNTATNDLAAKFTNLFTDLPALDGIMFDDFYFPLYKFQITDNGDGTYSNRGHYKVAYTVSGSNIHKAGHGLATGDVVKFTTTGSIPGGLNTGHEYIVVKQDSDNFRVAVNERYAKESTPYTVTLSSAGTGTQYYHSCSDSQARAKLASWCGTTTGAIHSAGKIASYAGKPANEWGNYVEDMVDYFDVIYPETYKSGNVITQTEHLTTRKFQEADVSVSGNTIGTVWGYYHELQTGDPVTFYSDGTLPSPLKSFSIADTDVNAGSNQISISGHGLSENSEVRLHLTSGTMLGGVNPDTNYYVHVVDSGHIQLATGAGKDIVDISSATTSTYILSQVYYAQRVNNDDIRLYPSINDAVDSTNIIDITTDGTLSSGYHYMVIENLSGSLKTIGTLTNAQAWVESMVVNNISYNDNDTCSIVPIIDITNYHSNIPYTWSDIEDEINILDKHNIQGYGLFPMNYVNQDIDFSTDLTEPQEQDSFISVTTQGVSDGEGVVLSSDGIALEESTMQMQIKAPVDATLLICMGTATHNVTGTGDWEEETFTDTPTLKELSIITDGAQAITFYIDKIMVEVGSTKHDFRIGRGAVVTGDVGLEIIKVNPTTIKSDSIPADDITIIGKYVDSDTTWNLPENLAQQCLYQTWQGVNLKRP